MMIDARGFSCPMPVSMVHQEVKRSAPAELVVLVDDPCAVENVTRFGTNSGYKVSVAKEGNDFRLMLKK